MPQLYKTKNYIIGILSLFLVVILILYIVKLSTITSCKVCIECPVCISCPTRSSIEKKPLFPTQDEIVKTKVYIRLLGTPYFMQPNKNNYIT